MSYSYSLDRVRFYGKFETREQALEEARLDEPEGSVWTARNVAPDYRRFFPGADLIIELMEGATADDEHGGLAVEDTPWLEGVSKEEEEFLRVLLHGALSFWVESLNKKPSWFVVEEVWVHEG